MADVPLSVFKKVFSFVGGIFIYIKKNFVPDPSEYISKKVVGGTITQIDNAPYTFLGLTSSPHGHYIDLNLDNYWFDVYFYQFSSDTLYSRHDHDYIEQIRINGQRTDLAFPISGNYDGFTACYDSGDDENYIYWLRAKTDGVANGFKFSIEVDRCVFDATVFGSTAITMTSLTDVDYTTSTNTSWNNVDGDSTNFVFDSSQIKYLTYGVPSDNGKKVAYTIMRGQAYEDSYDNYVLKTLWYSYVFVLDIDTMTITLKDEGAWFNPTIIDHFTEEEMSCVEDSGCTLSVNGGGASNSTLTYPISAGFVSNTLEVVTCEVNLAAGGYQASGFGAMTTYNHSFSRSYSGSANYKIKFGSTIWKSWGSDWSYVYGQSGSSSTSYRTYTGDREGCNNTFKIFSIARKEVSFKETSDRRVSNTWVGGANDNTDTLYKLDHSWDDVNTNINWQERTTNLPTAQGYTTTIWSSENRTYTTNNTVYSESGAKQFYWADSDILNSTTPAGYYISHTEFGYAQHNSTVSSMRSGSDDTSIAYKTIARQFDDPSPPEGWTDTVTDINVGFTKDFTTLYGALYVNGELMKDTNWEDGTWKWPAIQYSVRVALP